MIRVLNLVCVALMGLSILALYHVSEKTRVAHMQLTQVKQQIAEEKAHIGVLETEWQSVASPERIQQLAQAKLNMAAPAGDHRRSCATRPPRATPPPQNIPPGPTPPPRPRPPPVPGLWGQGGA